MPLKGTVAAVALAVAGAAAAPTAAAAPRVATGVLGAETTITWSGATAIRLAVSRATEYRDGDVDLTVSGATYAFVRLMAPYAPGCPADYGPRCATNRVSWVKGVHDTPVYAGRAPARRHDAAFGAPALIRPPYLLAYLFTDGRATLTIRTTSLRGRTAYRPATRVHGMAARLTTDCAPVGCVPGTGLSHGGAAFDLRGAGWSEVWAMHLSDPATASVPQVHTLTTCLYPHHHHPAASPDPADHPLGCDETSPGGAVTATTTHALNHAGTAPPSGGTGRNFPWSGASGLQYAGFQAVGAGPAPSDVLAYGVWFRYLD
jgi:hypothetical protein